MHICMCFFMLAPAPGAYFGLLVAQMLGQHAICCQRRVRTGNTYNTDLVLLGPVFLQKGVFLLKCNIPCKKKHVKLWPFERCNFSSKNRENCPAFLCKRLALAPVFLWFPLYCASCFGTYLESIGGILPTRDGCVVVLTMVRGLDKIRRWHDVARWWVLDALWVRASEHSSEKISCKRIQKECCIHQNKSYVSCCFFNLKRL